ncbi:MAG: Gfo/Idh/MocA family oxidoreductase [Lentisphaeria bacterium]|nr:Gfo/Idh/MocA family oxidoreductase [Lentisphaeria bacterium]
MDKPLNFGVIGCGVIAPTHVAGLAALPGARVTWACDLVEEKARALADKHGIPNISVDYMDVLGDDAVDAVCVCTDHASHAPIAVAAMNAGKHVLVEKALAASKDGLDAMRAAAKRHPDLAFGGVFQHRFDPEYQLLKRLVDEGAFGTILTAGVSLRCLRADGYYRGDPWRGTWDLEGGAVCINQAIHFVDSLLWIMGGARALCGVWRNMTHQDVMETEDTAVAMFQFKNGAVGTLEATCGSNIKWEPTLSIHGSDGGIELRHDKLVKSEFTDAEKAVAIQAEFAECKEKHAALLGKSYYGTGHVSQLANFAAAVREGRQPFVTGQSAAETVEAVLSIYESHASGKWVDLG